MATQFYEYDDDAGTKYPLALTDAQQAAYAAYSLSLPTAYATAAALLAAVSGSIAMPPGLLVRTVNLNTALFGTSQLPILNQTLFQSIEPTGATPFPTTPVSMSLDVSITGATGETRLSN